MTTTNTIDPSVIDRTLRSGLSLFATRQTPAPPHVVTERALVARINRRLRRDGGALRKCRVGSRWHSDLGDFYLLDVSRNSIAQTHIDPEAFARELGVMGHGERLA